MGIGSKLKKRLRGLGLFGKRDSSAAKSEGDPDGTMRAAPQASAASAPASRPSPVAGASGGGPLLQIDELGGSSPAASSPSQQEPPRSSAGRIILEAPALSTQAPTETSDEILIKAEPTAEGDECRFLVNRPLFDGRSWLFPDAASASSSPLPAAVFALDDVATLLVDDTTLTVTRQGPPATDWMPLARDVGRVIREQLLTGGAAVADDLAATIPDEDTIRDQIQDVIDNEVNPGVAAHSGYISLTRVRGNSVYISMGGGCQGCSAADLTLKRGIHQAFRDSVPEVGAIYDETDHAAGTNPYFS